MTGLRLRKKLQHVTVLDLAEKVKRKVANRSIVRSDYMLGEASKTKCGRGQWRKWMPRAMLRATFEYLHVAARTVGKILGTGHMHVQTVRFALLGFVSQRQAEVENTLATEPKDVIVYNTMLDDTKFDVDVPPLGMGTYDIMTQHTMVTGWNDETETISWTELFLAPCALSDQSADAMLQGVLDRQRRMFDILRNAELGCLCFSVDSVLANLRLVHHIFNTMLPNNTAGLLCKCVQHHRL